MNKNIFIGWILIVLFLIFTITIFIISGRTDKQCREICQEKGAISYLRVPNNKWFSLNDKCTCLYKSGSETFELGKGR